MTARTKTYIAFNADPETGDMNYYNLMKAWKAKNEINFDFENAHDLNNLRDGSLEATIKAKLRERMNAAKLLVLLVGTNTKFHHKFVRWEVEIALEAGIPIVVCNINGKRTVDFNLCPAILHDKLAIHVPFQADILQFAFNDWPNSHLSLKNTGVQEPRIYKDSVYIPLDAERERKEKAKLAALQALRTRSLFY